VAARAEELGARLAAERADSAAEWARRAVVEADADVDAAASSAAAAAAAAAQGASAASAGGQQQPQQQQGGREGGNGERPLAAAADGQQGGGDAEGGGGGDDDNGGNPADDDNDSHGSLPNLAPSSTSDSDSDADTDFARARALSRAMSRVARTAERRAEAPRAAGGGGSDGDGDGDDGGDDSGHDDDEDDDDDDEEEGAGPGVRGPASESRRHGARLSDRRAWARVPGRLGPAVVTVDSDSAIGSLRRTGPLGLELEARANFSSCRANVAVFSGAWYYEAALLTAGISQVGWATRRCPFTLEEGVGDAPDSYAVDGKRVRRWSVRPAPYGVPWAQGDVYGCAIDLRGDRGRVSFYRNGEPLGSAYDDVRVASASHLAYFPALSMSHTERVALNFGAWPFRHAPPEGHLPLHAPPASRDLAAARYLCGCMARLARAAAAPGGGGPPGGAVARAADAARADWALRERSNGGVGGVGGGGGGEVAGGGGDRESSDSLGPGEGGGAGTGGQRLWRVERLARKMARRAERRRGEVLAPASAVVAAAAERGTAAAEGCAARPGGVGGGSNSGVGSGGGGAGAGGQAAAAALTAAAAATAPASATAAGPPPSGALPPLPSAAGPTSAAAVAAAADAATAATPRPPPAGAKAAGQEDGKTASPAAPAPAAAAAAPTSAQPPPASPLSAAAAARARGLPWHDAVLMASVLVGPLSKLLDPFDDARGGRFLVRDALLSSLARLHRRAPPHDPDALRSLLGLLETAGGALPASPSAGGRAGTDDDANSDAPSPQPHPPPPPPPVGWAGAVLAEVVRCCGEACRSAAVEPPPPPPPRHASLRGAAAAAAAGCGGGRHDGLEPSADAAEMAARAWQRRRRRLSRPRAEEAGEAGGARGGGGGRRLPFAGEEVEGCDDEDEDEDDGDGDGDEDAEEVGDVREGATYVLRALHDPPAELEETDDNDYDEDDDDDEDEDDEDDGDEAEDEDEGDAPALVEASSSSGTAESVGTGDVVATLLWQSLRGSRALCGAGTAVSLGPGPPSLSSSPRSARALGGPGGAAARAVAEGFGGGYAAAALAAEVARLSPPAVRAWLSLPDWTDVAENLLAHRSLTSPDTARLFPLPYWPGPGASAGAGAGPGAGQDADPREKDAARASLQRGVGHLSRSLARLQDAQAGVVASLSAHRLPPAPAAPARMWTSRQQQRGQRAPAARRRRRRSSRSRGTCSTRTRAATGRRWRRLGCRTPRRSRAPSSRCCAC